MDFVKFFATNKVITGFLLEFEDTLPYKGNLECVRADRHEKCYTEEQIKKLVKYIKEDLKLKIVPLVQVFSHLEYVLKRNQFKDLREEPEKMLSLCPLKDGSIDLVLELINQTIGFVGLDHLDYFHIGADEIFNIGSCPECKLFCQETNHRVLYAKFLRKVVKKLSKKYPL